jgi:hypothetical protein
MSLLATEQRPCAVINAAAPYSAAMQILLVYTELNSADRNT